jgi:FAD/FMN-containing dehydrogenase
LKHLVIGSEGVLGVITKALMRVHRVPAVQIFEGTTDFID